MIFADATPPKPESFLQFWLSIGLIASVFSNVVVAVVVLANRKQKREINFALEPASKEEFEQHVRDTHAAILRLESNRGEDLRNAALSRKGIYDELGRVRRELTDKIDNVPSQLIATLRNFGVIGK